LFVVSLVFTLIGFAGPGSRSDIDGIRMVCGVFGAALFLGFFRGLWMTTGGASTHVFSITDVEIEWGMLGKEKRLPMSELAAVYWDEVDGFTLVMTRKDGTRIRFPDIQTVVPLNSRGSLLAFLRMAHPTIPISGHIDPKTEQNAAGLLSAGPPSPGNHNS
jgi:hypothetical protein